MLPTETIRLALKEAVEAQSMTFFFGTDADAFLAKLESDSQLTTDGFAFMLDSTDKIKKLDEDWLVSPIRMSFLRQTLMGAVLLDEDEQGSDTARQDLRTAMYDKWIDVMEYVRDSVLNMEIQEGWEFGFVTFGENVTEGVMVDFNIVINGYC
jgi:hypothetical protein